MVRLRLGLVLVFLLISLTVVPSGSRGVSLVNKDAEFVFVKSDTEPAMVYPLDCHLPIFSFTVSGKVTLNKEASFLRVILVDKNDEEYLVLEAYPLLDGVGSLIVENSGDETSLLDQVTPKELRIEGYQASFVMDGFFSSDSLEKLNFTTEVDIAAEREKLREERERINIQKINGQIKIRKMAWVAGETSLSKLTYSQKKKLFQEFEGKSAGKPLNLQGYEHYKGGIFELKGDSAMVTASPSLLPVSWDWRDVHSENWLTSVKNQESVCGSCWAFSAIGAVEAVANLYFNQHLNLDLSEQELISCSQAGNCSGGWHKTALAYIRETGVVEEECSPYQGRDTECSLCPEGQRVRIAGSQYVPALPGKEDVIKRVIITQGPLSVRIAFLNHAAVLVGWETDSSGNTIWIIKDSWGTFFGEQGYLKIWMPTDQMEFSSSITTPVTLSGGGMEVTCFDKDGDGYCNWGISQEKPSSCLNCRQEKDCNDADPGLGPFDQNFNCQRIITVTPTPASGWAGNPCGKECKPGFYCKCETVPGNIREKGGCYCVKE